ncbi:hypothetical protein GPECTOR_13g627 [Gonium pectorale]|uniref:Uncharacterized protein n=1 Tax=Gonium pectorale TaxID=33097 RepID=A0A150GP88_GONPE|nr:hypothetical protein GPECTOR_13g627 [Gonium pectorale]|eukprot:KXZ51140.1 hypothetical protein GPECTOR_13g627 [Gonium pectorale]
MAAFEIGEEAIARGNSALALPNVWIPELVERFASFLHPNVVICTLRCVDKATAKQFGGRPEFATVRLSQAVPPHAFAARWASPGAMRDLTLARRKEVLCLTAASGVVANLEVAIDAAGMLLDAYQLTALLHAAAAAGHAGAVRHLAETERKLALSSGGL